MKRVSKKATTYSPTNAVPSAQTGLTSLFGKVRGEPHRNNHLKSFGVCRYIYLTVYKNILKKERYTSYIHKKLIFN